MDKKIFFDAVRKSFGGSLSQGQVTGIEAILTSCQKWKVFEAHHIANVMGQSAHETGGQMLPVKETVYASSSNRNPTDAQVIARLDNAWKHGDLPWVKTPYWRDGWFGRGIIQLSHERMYRILGDALGVDLVGERDKALDIVVSADVAVVGMSRGLFTGKKLGDFKFPDALVAPPKYNPRRIVNGQDGTDGDVAKLHTQFYNALVVAGYEPSPVPVARQARTRSVIITEIEALLAELKTAGE